MQPLLLVSILIMTVAIPALAGRVPDERRGLRLALIGMAIFLLLYLLGLRFLYTGP